MSWQSTESGWRIAEGERANAQGEPARAEGESTQVEGASAGGESKLVGSLVTGLADLLPQISGHDASAIAARTIDALCAEGCWGYGALWWAGDSAESEDHLVLRILAQAGPMAEQVAPRPSSITCPVGSWPAGVAWQRRTTIRFEAPAVPPETAGPATGAIPATLAGAVLVGLRSGLSVPVVADGTVLGVLDLVGDEDQAAGDWSSRMRSAQIVAAMLAPVLARVPRQLDPGDFGPAVSIRNIADRARVAGSSAIEAKGRAERAREALTELGQATFEAESVAKVLASIAAQTSLLALNAAIEAFRPGAHGKDFAAMAAQVKDLAQQTSEATGEVEQRIGAIQQDTAGAVAEIGAVVEAVERASDLSTQVVEELLGRLAALDAGTP